MKMTEKQFQTLVSQRIIKAFALVCVLVGGTGCIACLPFAFSTNLTFIAISAVLFVAGGIMIVGGLNTLAILNQRVEVDVTA